MKRWPAMHLVWCTDLHLNFLRPAGAARSFGEYLAAEHEGADGLLLTGDLSEAPTIERHLAELARGWAKPVYFVTGNHDYYRSSFAEVDDALRALTRRTPNLHWLNEAWHLHRGLPIVGVGGWYDARYGNPHTKVAIHDFDAIADLRPGRDDREALLPILRSRARSEAERLSDHLGAACETVAETILVCTHVPPYAEAAWHEGKLSDANWVPWFSSASTGEVIDAYATRYPTTRFVVLTGHTHSAGIYERAENVTVYTGPARYGAPDVAGGIDVEGRRLWAHDPEGQRVHRPC